MIMQSPFSAVPRQSGITTYPITNPIVVSPSFFGVCSTTWPWNGVITGVAPTFSVGRLSNYDNPATHWRTLHTATNTINWATIDTWVANAKSAGVAKGVYCLYGCPTFIASTGAAVAGPYGGLGEGAFPSVLGQLDYFCTQFAARNISTWGKFFDSVSLLNEPDFNGTPSASSYWWGTKQQLVDTMYTAYAALKAADPTLTILSPGVYVIRGATGVDQWIDQAGAVNPTKRGKDCFDAISSHPYHVYPSAPYGYLGDPGFCSTGGVSEQQSILTQYEKSVSGYYCTEYGVSSVVDAELNAFLAKTPAYRALFMQRLLMAAAAYGYKYFLLFAYGNSNNLCGNLSTDSTGVILGIQNAYDLMAGKTIVSGGWWDDGSVQLTFSDSSTIRV